MKNIIDKYLNHLTTNQNTVQAYRSDLLQFIALEKIETVEEIDETVLLSYSEKLKEMKPTTIARKISALRGFGTYLVEEGLLEENFMLKLISPRIQKEKKRSMTSLELKRLLRTIKQSDANLKKRDECMIRVLHETNITAEEMLNLTVDNYSSGNINGLSRNTKGLIDKYLQERNGGTYLFTNFRGEKLSRQALWKIINQYDPTVSITMVKNSR